MGNDMTTDLPGTMELPLSGLPAGRIEIYAGTGSGDRNFGWFHFPGRRHAGPPLFIPRGVTP